MTKIMKAAIVIGAVAVVYFLILLACGERPAPDNYPARRLGTMTRP